MPPIRVNIVSESDGFEAQGVHTAFLDMVDALSKRPEVELLVNVPDKGDILHAHTFGTAYVRKRSQYPGRRIMTAHVIPDSLKGSLIGWQLWLPVAERMMRIAYNSVDIVLAVAPHVKEDLKRIGVETRIEVLTNPVNEARFYVDPAFRVEGRKRLGLADDAKVALCVGQIQPRKGVAEFIETARLCPDVTFVWLGGRPFGGLTADVKGLDGKIAAATPNVHFPGTVKLEEMPLYYSAADILFFPSWQENCALAINEAMACGVPLLLKDNPEYPALYGADSYLKATDPQGFAWQIQAFFNDSALRNQLREASLQVAKSFSVTTYADFLVKLYQELMENKPA
jgi:1,2-diacylglycerol-3-alpha-glucose alpha-1,2-galactosyltransferase